MMLVVFFGTAWALFGAEVPLIIVFLGWEKVVYPFKDKFVLTAVCSDTRTDMFLIDQGKYDWCPLMYSLALEPEFLYRSCMSDSTSIMTCDGLLPDVELGFGCGQKRCGVAALILGMVMKFACCGVGVYI
jgi:hypothetical protein